MPKKRLVGLYLGVNSVGGVIVENKKITASLTYELSTVNKDPNIENVSIEGVNEDIKWEALINKLLRDLNAENKEVCVSFCDKDFIFRALEMPLMSDREITASLIYEIEKYIPFKLEELRWDYFYLKSYKDKKIYVSFVGIRETNFQRITDIFSHLGLTPKFIEPSAVSLLRSLDNIKEFAALQNFALLDFTSLESYITFFHQRFPVFNRYFMINRNEQGIDFEKFIESVRFSFQYFKREYKTYNLDKLVIIADSLDETIKNNLQEELQTEIKVILPADFISIINASVENVKALGVAARGYSSLKLTPVLKSTEMHISSEDTNKLLSLDQNTIKFIASLAIILVLGFFSFLKYKVIVEKSRINNEEQNIKVPIELKGISWEMQKKRMLELSDKLKLVKELEKYTPKIEKFIEALQIMTPKGLWLESFDFYSGEEGKGVICNISGNVFLQDAYEERTAINNFIAGMKKNPEVGNLFKNIDMRSSERQKIGDFNVTSFKIELS